MNFALANTLTIASTSSLHTTAHGCFVAHLVRRIHFDQSVETICGGGPQIVNLRSPLQAAVARHNTESHTLKMHGRPSTTHSSTTPRCTTTQSTTTSPDSLCTSNLRSSTFCNIEVLRSENSRKVQFTQSASTNTGGDNHPLAAPTGDHPETTFSEHNFPVTKNCSCGPLAPLGGLHPGHRGHSTVRCNSKQNSHEWSDTDHYFHASDTPSSLLRSHFRPEAGQRPTKQIRTRCHSNRKGTARARQITN